MIKLRKVKSQTKKENHKDALRVISAGVAKGVESSTRKWYVTWRHVQMANYFYETRLQGIMVVVFNKTIIQSKMMNMTAIITCQHISYRKLPITMVSSFLLLNI